MGQRRWRYLLWHICSTSISSSIWQTCVVLSGQGQLHVTWTTHYHPSTTVKWGFTCGCSTAIMKALNPCVHLPLHPLMKHHIKDKYSTTNYYRSGVQHSSKPERNMGVNSHSISREGLPCIPGSTSRSLESSNTVRCKLGM